MSASAPPQIADLPPFSFYAPEYRGWERYATAARHRDADPGLAVDELGRVWLFRFDDVRAVLTSKDGYRGVEDEFARSIGYAPDDPYRRFARNQLITANPPAHTRMKNASRYFTRQHVTPLEEVVRRRCDELIDTFPDEGVIEFVDDFAFKLPVSVIMRVLRLPEADEDELHELSPRLVPADTEPETRAPTNAANQRFQDYANAVIAEREAHPLEGDIVTELIASRDRGEIDPDHVWGLIISLIVAGHGTTTNALALGMHTLLGNRDQLELIREDPALLPNAAAELLRYEPPLDGAPRIANQPVEFGGIEFPRDTRIALSIASANRDARQFPDGDRFDVRRPNAGRHLTFSAGIHRCLGAPLAQLQIPIAIGALLERLEVIEPAGDAVLLDSVFRGLRSLPLYVKRRS